MKYLKEYINFDEWDDDEFVHIDTDIKIGDRVVAWFKIECFEKVL